MGQWNQNNYIVKVWTKIDMTDPRVIEFVKDYNFTQEEYVQFLNEGKPFFHPHAKKILDFICTYKSGILYPDKWGGWEPLKRDFTDESMPQVINSLATQNTLLFKKRRKVDFEIDNDARKWSPCWIVTGRGKNIKRELVRPFPFPVTYTTKIRFIYSVESKPDPQFLKELMDDLCEYLDTDYGIVYHMKTEEVLFSYKGTKLLKYPH